MYEYDQNQDYPSYTPPEHSGMATASMILGILGIIGSMCCYFALPMSAIGILLALLSRGNNKHLSSRAKNGLWLSIASLVLTVGMTGYTLYKYRDIINSPQFQQQMEDYLEYYYGGKEAQDPDSFLDDLLRDDDDTSSDQAPSEDVSPDNGNSGADSSPYGTEPYGDSSGKWWETSPSGGSDMSADPGPAL